MSTWVYREDNTVNCDLPSQSTIWKKNPDGGMHLKLR